ncbi:hypothetical protein DICPUDRAFT_19597, partial [Dictyostelium purpureum]
SNYRIKSKELTFPENIDFRGGFGEVKKAKWRGIDVATKVITRDQDYKGKNKQELFEQEVSMNYNLRHPNIVQFLGVVMKSKTMVMEYMNGGTLRELLNQINILNSFKENPMFPVKIAMDIALPLLYLHKSSILHRDLTSSNVLIQTPLDLKHSNSMDIRHCKFKISDFGVSKVKNGSSTPRVGNISHMAPEVYQSKPYTEASDVFSYGMILWELITTKIHCNETQDKLLQLELSPLATPKWKKLIVHCLEESPDERPTVEEILVQLKNIKN